LLVLSVDHRGLETIGLILHHLARALNEHIAPERRQRDVYAPAATAVETSGDFTD